MDILVLFLNIIFNMLIPVQTEPLLKEKFGQLDLTFRQKVSHPEQRICNTWYLVGKTIYHDVGEDGLFEPEYVNIFGVPFTFLPHEGGENGPPPPPPPPKTEIKPIIDKSEHEISFPNVLRIDHVYKPQLSLNIVNVKPLELDSYSFELFSFYDDAWHLEIP